MMRFLICIFYSLLLSCGRQDFPDYQADFGIQEENPSGVFYGQFEALNTHKVGLTQGHSTIWVRGNQFYVKVVLERGKANTRYEQYIYSGGRCPKNQDISGSEIIKSVGEELIPLDWKLNTHLNRFPYSNRKGTFSYTRSAKLNNLLKELRASKLREDEFLDLHRRTLVLYVLEKNVRLPVACARLKEEWY